MVPVAAWQLAIEQLLCYTFVWHTSDMSTRPQLWSHYQSFNVRNAAALENVVVRHLAVMPQYIRRPASLCVFDILSTFHSHEAAYDCTVDAAGPPAHDHSMIYERVHEGHELIDKTGCNFVVENRPTWSMSIIVSLLQRYTETLSDWKWCVVDSEQRIKVGLLTV